MVKHKATRVIPRRWYGSAAGLFHLIWLWADGASCKHRRA
jgi:hypothetical protein